MEFIIEQVALHPRDPERAKALLRDMGMTEWAIDHVSAHGSVFGRHAPRSEAELAFNYQGLGAAKELEVLHYTAGRNWMARLFRPRWRVSHLGMHCTEEALAAWRDFFRDRGIRVAQELWTDAHTNPVIAGKRKYHYVIFDTYDILGVDVKFIIRHDPLDF